MQIDKEMLIKQRYWILLGLYAPLLLTVLILMWTVVAPAVGAKAQDFAQVRDGLKPLAENTSLENDKFVEVLEERNQKAEQKKKEIWSNAWDAQKSLFTWPEALQAQLGEKYFGDPLGDPTDDPTGERIRDKYANEYYLPFVREIVKVVDPLEKGSGVVQFKDGWRSQIKYIKDQPWPEKPTDEDVWLAQEDLWIYKGLLLGIKGANDSVATFHEEQAAARGRRGSGQVFANPNWRLDLAVAQDPKSGERILQGRVTNITNRRLPLGLRFHLFFSSTNPESLFVDGEPLPPGQWVDFRHVLRRGASEVRRVEQVFDWRSAPVKRIERMVMQAHSDRTAQREPIRDMEFAKRTGTDKDAGDTSRNGFERRRYIHVTPEVRRVPVGLDLIIDQADIQNVVTAIANSPLRIQVTQVEWQHFHGDLKPPKQDLVATGPGGTPRPSSGSGGPTSASPKTLGEGIGTGNRRGNTIGPVVQKVVDEEETDLVEIAVYGIATIYQKYPPPEKAPPAEAKK